MNDALKAAVKNQWHQVQCRNAQCEQVLMVHEKRMVKVIQAQLEHAADGQKIQCRKCKVWFKPLLNHRSNLPI